METLKFNDGTPPIEVKVLVRAETVLFCKDKDGKFSIIKRSKVDEGEPEVDFVEDSEDVEESIDETTGDIIENEKHTLL